MSSSGTSAQEPEERRRGGEGADAERVEEVRDEPDQQVPRLRARALSRRAAASGPAHAAHPDGQVGGGEGAQRDQERRFHARVYTARRRGQIGAEVGKIVLRDGARRPRRPSRRRKDELLPRPPGRDPRPREQGRHGPRTGHGPAAARAGRPRPCGPDAPWPSTTRTRVRTIAPRSSPWPARRGRASSPTRWTPPPKESAARNRSAGGPRAACRTWPCS